MLNRVEDYNDMENDPTADRNREPTDPDNNMNVDGNIEEVIEEEGDSEALDEDAFEEEGFGPQEFSALNSQLDQLQSALDSLETRNDDIHSKLLELLRSSREIRQDMKAENNRSIMEVQEVEESPDTGAGSSSSKSNITASSATSVQNCDTDSQNIPQENSNK